jgi:pyruvate dehydrogenase E2 component (dihydrolipoamide acetyltransferase)
MATKVVMPRLSLTMKEGTVGKWYKKEGEGVEKGEPIVEVISEKATYDLEAPVSGLIRKVLVEEGVDVPVGDALAVITAPDEPFSEAELHVQTPRAGEESEKRILASPSAKRLAKEHGIELSLVKGTGADGRIDEADVRRFIDETGGSLPKIKEIVPLSGIRKTSAERLSASFKTAPHSTIAMDVDFSNVALLHEKLQVSYTAIIVKAVAGALKEHPIINSTLDRDQIKLFEDVNIGTAVATKNGLVVPVIRDANAKTLREIDATISELTEKAVDEKLSREDVIGGTFTITNLGMYKVDFFTPIINPPEAAILGVGRIAKRPVVVNDEIQVKPVTTLSLSYDHRIVDGAPAADFLLKVKDKIEKGLDSGS